MKRFTVEVMGGLCSRLRAVVGAMAYCDKFGMRLTVHWPSQERNYPTGFAAKLSDIWQYSRYVSEIDAKTSGNKDNSVLDGRDAAMLRTCHIEPFLQFMPNGPREYMHRFPLSPAVWDYKLLIERQIEGKKVVGVHIRHDIKQP